MATKSLTWPRLVPGLLAGAAVIAAAAAILIVGRVGALHGDTIRLFVATNQARGVIPGSDVWLEGQRVGKVRRIGFRDPSVDTSVRILMELEILESHRRYIRADSYAQIRSGGTLIGSPVVYVTTGTSRAAGIRQGDTLAAATQADFEGVTSQIALAGQNFPAIRDNVKLIMTHLEGARGTIGALGLDQNRREIDVLRTRAGGLAQRATRSDGTIALALRDGRLKERARIAMARTDSVRTLIAGSAERFGRFRRDTTLLESLGDIRNEVSVVRALLASAAGTAGRVGADSAIVNELARVERELGELMRDIKRHPMRYVHFE